MQSWCIKNGCILSVDPDWGSIAWLIAICSLHYLQPYHWPTHRTICVQSSCSLTAAWQCIRIMPLDDDLRNRICRLCYTCEWYIGRDYFGYEQCCECFNPFVCRLCTYYVPWQGFRCYQCELLPRYIQIEKRKLVEVNCHALTAHDSLLGQGDDILRKQLVRMLGQGDYIPRAQLKRVSFAIWRHKTWTIAEYNWDHTIINENDPATIGEEGDPATMVENGTPMAED